MKADDLRSLEKTECMMVRWMCGVSLKDIKSNQIKSKHFIVQNENTISYKVNIKSISN